MTVLVVIACHFESENKLCDTTIRRLESALTEKRQHAQDPWTPIWVTGKVPYQKGGITLGELMKTWLSDHGIVSGIIAIGRGVGTFSEARNVTAEIADVLGGGTRIIVISSDWYLWAGKMIWRKFGREQGLRVSFLPNHDTGGWRTRLTYMAYAAIVRASFLFGVSNFVEASLNEMQTKRSEGFTWNGCA